MSDQPSMEEQADALERQQIEELGNRVVGKSLFYFLSDGEQTTPAMDGVLEALQGLR